MRAGVFRSSGLESSAAGKLSPSSLTGDCLEEEGCLDEEAAVASVKSTSTEKSTAVVRLNSFPDCGVDYFLVMSCLRITQNKVFKRGIFLYEIA